MTMPQTEARRGSDSAGTLERLGVDVPADGFCPYCKALASEACHTATGAPRDDHKGRHPMPPRPEPTNPWADR